MQTEESLDHLIDQHISEENQLSPTGDEIAALLAAAKRLLQLQEIAIPSEFARHLEASIRARTHHLLTKQAFPDLLDGHVTQ